MTVILARIDPLEHGTVNEIGIRRSTLAAVVVVSITTLSGCDNFENSLTWDESPAADSLLGSWRLVEGEKAGTRAEVTRGDGGSFDVRMFVRKDVVPSAAFTADLVAADSVNVLQIRMGTYKEGARALHGQVTRHGFRFRRASIAGNELTLQRLDIGALGKLAEEAYAGTGIQLTAETVAGCVGEDLMGTLWGGLWSNMSEQLGEDLRAEVLTALGESASEVEEELAKLAELEVDPYAELAKMRTCIARHLPGEPLGELFRRFAEVVFVGPVDRYVRE